MRALLAGHPPVGSEAAEALQRAEASCRQASVDLEQAIRLRARTDEATEIVRAHNAANRYDDFLRRVVQGLG